MSSTRRDAGSLASTGKQRQGQRVRVKSGCRTCKVRRVKCDESRPVCSRCTSTGRTCEGYGIWGERASIGRGNLDTRLLSRGTKTSVPRTPAPISVLAGTTKEKDYFDWFKTCTLHKLTGSFVSRFWNTLVIQASFQEPAVMHAVLALSAVHRRGVDGNGEGTQATAAESRNQDQFALTHYLQAIQHLKTHFGNQGKASRRIALMACILFVTFEFFRGHIETGQCHLKSGHQILSGSADARDAISWQKPGQSFADDWILEAFSRLQFQVELFKLSYQGPGLALSTGKSTHSGAPFQSINECWYEMQRLINNILRLTDQCSHLNAPSEGYENYPALLEQQQSLQNELEQWLYAFQTLKATFSQGRMGYEEKKGYGILPVYHNMATIMAGVCLRPGDESVFDSYSTQFVVVVQQLAQIWTASWPASLHRHSSDRRLGSFLNTAHSYADIGWIPALFYTAIKCRVHRVRLQAIRLLECSTHREGIWDSQIAACIARKTMQLEERDFYEGVDMHDNFPLSGCPAPRDLLLPLIPSTYRIRKLGTLLSGEPVEKITLLGEGEENGRNQTFVLSEYSVHTQSWTDRESWPIPQYHTSEWLQPDATSSFV
ncbi:hypothetical protein GGR57DRAFT_287421 [Xylariaceae sp. FL1272]|nr:hypothetical protein GGR57DRAFT_287421 [Xylariaceae sp. FL1272]